MIWLSIDLLIKHFFLYMDGSINEILGKEINQLINKDTKVNNHFLVLDCFHASIDIFLILIKIPQKIIFIL